MTIEQARLLVSIIDHKRELDRLHQAINDTWRLFDKRNPEESNRIIARARAALAADLARAAAEYARLLCEFCG